MNTADLARRIRLGEDAILELKRVLLTGRCVASPHRNELAAFANSRGETFVLGIDDTTREVLGHRKDRGHVAQVADTFRATACASPTGARISSGLSVIGAIGGEFFAGYGTEDFGLGYLIILTNGQAKTDYLFACILFCTLLGLGLFTTVSSLSTFLLRRWTGAPE